MDHIAYQQPAAQAVRVQPLPAPRCNRARAGAPVPGAAATADERRVAAAVGRELLAAAVRKFWSPSADCLSTICPGWPRKQGRGICDRSLATAILFDQCPGGNTAAAVRALVECPPEMGLSYPCNACWRYWALARAGRADVVVRDFRQRWAKMKSVVLQQYAARGLERCRRLARRMEPLLRLADLCHFFGPGGHPPPVAGFARCRIHPQLADLPDLKLTYHTVLGPIHFAAERLAGGHRYTISVPSGCEAELLLPSPDHPERLTRRRLKSGKQRGQPAHRRGLGRTNAAEAWPWGVTLKLMKLAPGGTWPSRTAHTGQAGSGVR